MTFVSNNTKWMLVQISWFLQSFLKIFEIFLGGITENAYLCSRNTLPWG